MLRGVLALCALTSTAAYSVVSTGRTSALSSGGKDSASKCSAVLGQTAADDAWCLQNCGNTPPNCPPELCTCDGDALPSPSPVAIVPESEEAPGSEADALGALADAKTPEEADKARAEGANKGAQ